MINSYLKWSGGKRNALPTLLPFINGILNDFAIKRLVEPFTGSATVALNVEVERYLLADSNNDLIQTHRAITNAESLPIFLDQLETLFSHGYDGFHQLRDRFNTRPENDIEMAALFLYLNKYGFNGLCRYNKSGKFNVSSGKNASGVKFKKPQLELIHQFKEKLSHAEFLAQGFEETFNQVQPGDLVYCDPPYVPATSSKYNYTAEGFTFDDQVRLKELAKSANVPVMISNHANDLTRELYSDSDIFIQFPVGRQISCKSHTRQPAMECIALYQ